MHNEETRSLTINKEFVNIYMGLKLLCSSFGMSLLLLFVPYMIGFLSSLSHIR